MPKVCKQHRQDTSFCTCDRILKGISGEQGKFSKNLVDDTTHTINIFETLRVWVMRARGGNTRRKNKGRAEIYMQARTHYRRATRKGLWVNGIKVVYSSIEDRWHRDEPYRNELIRLGHSLDEIKRWREIGPTKGQDQHLFEIPRRRREELFTSTVVLRNAVRGVGKPRHQRDDYRKACAATRSYASPKAQATTSFWQDRTWWSHSQ